MSTNVYNPNSIRIRIVRAERDLYRRNTGPVEPQPGKMTHPRVQALMRLTYGVWMYEDFDAWERAGCPALPEIAPRSQGRSAFDRHGLLKHERPAPDWRRKEAQRSEKSKERRRAYQRKYKARKRAEGV